MVKASEERRGASPQATFGRNLRQMREARQMTQTDLVHALSERGMELHRQTIHKIEQDDRPLRFDEAVLIAEILEVDLSEMLQEAPEYSLYQQLRTQMDREAQASDQLAAHLSVMQRELELLRNSLEEFEESDWQSVLTGSALEMAERRVRMARLTVDGGLDGAITRARQKTGGPQPDDDAPAS